MTDQGAETRGPHHALLQPSGRRFPVSGDATLLASAAAQGIELASSCRNGTCRACLRRLHAGSVAYRIPWPGLLPEERDGSWVLPCVAYPQSDVVMSD